MQSRTSRFLLALWLGSAVFIILTAQAVFRVAGDATTAANVVGAMLTRWHYISLLAPIGLLIIARGRITPLVHATLLAAVFCASLQAIVDIRIRWIRNHTAMSISSLPSGAPLRREFGMLHGASMLLLLLQTIAATVVTSARGQEQIPEVSGPPSTFKVIVNDEEQFSIWPADRPQPRGWRDADFEGTRQQCLDHIAKVWKDVRPLSLRGRV